MAAAAHFTTDEIFSVNENSFNDMALRVFRFQFEQNPVYRSFCESLGCNPDNVSNTGQIPFLPVNIFKSREVKTTDFVAEKIFETSSTTGIGLGRHFVKDLSVYNESLLKGFNHFFEPPAEWCICGLLPSYLDRPNSSLVYMVEKLIEKSKNADGGFFNTDLENLAALLQKNEAAGKSTFLIGVTFALLDFAEKYPMPLNKSIMMETGGMKGRREEITRDQVHDTLTKAFSLSHIYSEYGMTEMLSQAYSYGHGIFSCPPWMQVLIRREDDPLDVVSTATMQGFKAKGVINIIDLANVYSCSFLATDDLGLLHIDGRFEVNGRTEAAEIRGCSQLTA